MSPGPAHTEVSALELEIEDANEHLARSKEVPRDFEDVVGRVADAVMGMQDDLEEVDPYLVAALLRGAIGSLRALSVDDPQTRRSTLRVSLEQARQALRDIEEGTPTRVSVPVKEVVRWLDSVVEASQRTLARLLNTSPRTYQRWVSANDRAEPRDQDATRVRMVAAVVNHLRHAMTSRGAVDWFFRPHPELKGERPFALLDKAENLPTLTLLASSARSSGAT
jgi:uncharacterized protein (DUF2384 family)